MTDKSGWRGKLPDKSIQEEMRQRARAMRKNPTKYDLGSGQLCEQIKLMGINFVVNMLLAVTLSIFFALTLVL